MDLDERQEAQATAAMALGPSSMTSSHRVLDAGTGTFGIGHRRRQHGLT